MAQPKDSPAHSGAPAQYDHAPHSMAATPEQATEHIIEQPLRNDVRLLGQLLGQILKQHAGEALFNQVEQIRHLAKDARDGQPQAETALQHILQNLADAEILPLTRAFSYFLTFANIAEQYHVVRQRRATECAGQSANPLDQLMLELKTVEPDVLYQHLLELKIELVLTAHPTEVSRRTLIQKYDHINRCLSTLDQSRLTPKQQQQTIEELQQLICSAWHSDEIRAQRPTPIDEAKWGFTTIEQTLWQTLPKFVREINELCQKHTGRSLPLHATPIRFASWMGGDRDGNPNVTHSVTQDVLWLSRWQAADLYLKDIDALRWELSVQPCSAALRAALGQSHPEPYREYLRTLRDQLQLTRDWLSQRLLQPLAEPEQLIRERWQLLQPLQLCYDSLMDSGLTDIANGRLLDVIYRVHCFGIELLKLDIRQESGRHRQVLAAITDYLGLGDYYSWNERQRQDFIVQELENKRPLLPKIGLPTDGLLAHPEVQETLATFNMLATQPSECLGAYVISMAEYPSDVLAVMLLQKEAGIQQPLRVVPLFETLKDLEGAATTLSTLFSIEAYQKRIAGQQEVMIGYSDSAKDAGFMSANWAQYRAQEQLSAVARQYGVALTLFHGRGGSISRGGAPTQQALYSQPPGSIKGAIRVTEQGEMIRFKFGVPEIALQNMQIYAAATLKASILPPPEPKAAWRELMQQMTAISVDVYRKTVREQPHFVQYLRSVTPELELQMLPLGSRPAKRKVGGGIESLRAIPWVFAWTQIRLMLPAWLGTGAAIQQMLDVGARQTLLEMLAQWPYFETLIDMLEMVLSKSDLKIASYYEQHLTREPELLLLGHELRQRLQQALDSLLELKGQSRLLHHNQALAQSMRIRAPYLLPLHLLQAELMKRRRLHLANNPHGQSPVDHALMVSIAGIAAGLRNTG